MTFHEIIAQFSLSIMSQIQSHNLLNNPITKDINKWKTIKWNKYMYLSDENMCKQVTTGVEKQ